MAKNTHVIGVRDLKAHASAVLREVCETGAEYIVSVRGRPVARIEPLGGDIDAQSIDGMGNLRGAMADLPRLDWDDFVAAKRLWDVSLPNDE